jgi:hypothetical protein
LIVEDGKRFGGQGSSILQFCNSKFCTRKNATLAKNRGFGGATELPGVSAVKGLLARGV